MRVAYISEFYPRRNDPVLGVWAHRQALAARDAGAEVKVLVLHRPVPPRSALRGGARGALGSLRSVVSEPLHQVHDGLDVRYVPFLAPPRWRSYPQWGAWAAAPLALALRRLRTNGGFDLAHAHNAVPTADATRRALRLIDEAHKPLVVSVHGGDVLYTAHRFASGGRTVAAALGAARLTLANSSEIAALAHEHGAGATRVVHLGADLPERLTPSHQDPPELVTVAHLVARKRQADVIRALAVLSDRHPTLRYTIVGEGPERDSLEALAARLGVDERVQLLGQLEPEAALQRAQRCTLFVMPSTEEAFGVAYIEAMAAGVPALGCRGEPGPEEIAAAGAGLILVPPGDVERLSQRIDELLSDRERLRAEGRHARQTVADHFTWERCGQETVAAYEEALAR